MQGKFCAVESRAENSADRPTFQMKKLDFERLGDSLQIRSKLWLSSHPRGSTIRLPKSPLPHIATSIEQWLFQQRVLQKNLCFNFLVHLVCCLQTSLDCAHFDWSSIFLAC